MRCFAWAALLLLGACGMDPRLRFTLPEAAPRFANAPADAPTAWPERAWWRAFGSPELDALIAEAEAGEATLRAAAFRIAQSEATASILRAPLVPSLGSSGGLSQSRSNAATGSGGGITRENASVALTASYEVDLWGRLRSSAAAGGARLLSSRYDRDALALSVTAQTAQIYFDVLALRRRVALARESLGIAQRIGAVIDVQVRAGAAGELELQQQRAAIAAVEASLENLAGQERQALAALALLLGRRPDQLRIAATSLEGLTPPAITAGLPADLLARRPDIARAEANLRAAGLDAAAARAARFPSLLLTAPGGLQSADLTNFLTPERAVWSLAASLVGPILTGGRLRATEDLAVARAQELAEVQAGTVLTAFQDVEAALAAAEATRRALALRRVGFEAAQRAYRIAELRWRTGSVDFVSVLQSQQAAFSAAEQLALAELARLSAIVSLYRALGGGWGG